jgi:NAD(P)-dependent dehydrogenase (short-subunit alcohol dehydrogenase family)
MTAVSIEGKTVVITGAASGIGRALALGFARDGAHVIATDVNEAGLREIASANIATLAVDVSRDADVKRMVAFATEQTGRLDVLFNNAGLGGARPIEQIEDDMFERYIRVHLFGAYYGLRAALPMMRTQGFGRVINTLSRHAGQRARGFSAYASAKAGMLALTRVAAAEVLGVDILVNGMIPGPTRSGMMKGDNLQEPEAVYPGALWLATLPAGGPNGKVFWNKREIDLFAPEAGAGAKQGEAKSGAA